MRDYRGRNSIESGVYALADERLRGVLCVIHVGGGSYASATSTGRFLYHHGVTPRLRPLTEAEREDLLHDKHNLPWLRRLSSGSNSGLAVVARNFLKDLGTKLT